MAKPLLKEARPSLERLTMSVAQENRYAISFAMSDWAFSSLSFASSREP